MKQQVKKGFFKDIFTMFSRILFLSSVWLFSFIATSFKSVATSSSFLFQATCISEGHTLFRSAMFHEFSCHQPLTFLDVQKSPVYDCLQPVL